MSIDTKAIIDKFIEREERYMVDAESRQDVDDHKFHKARKQAFKEVKPFVKQLLDENKLLQKENEDWRKEANYLSNEKFDISVEIQQLQADKAVAVDALKDIIDNSDDQGAIDCAKGALERIQTK